jgi:hypothetical protein
MKRVAVIGVFLCCVCADVRAQSGAPVGPELMRAFPSRGTEVLRPRSHVLGGLHLSALGVVGTAAFSLSDQRDRTAEVVIGFGRAHSAYVPDALINGVLYAQALHILPVYLGLRLTLARGGGTPVSWSWYVRGGAGPALGLVTPLGLEFFDALRASTFHWGLGVYAASGLEFVVDNSVAFFVQVGAEGIGFLPSLDDRSALLGPSVTFGVGRLLP